MTDPLLGRVRTPGDLHRLNDADLRRYVDTTSHSITAGDALQELYRRAADQRERLITWLTVAIFALTLVVTAATVLLLIRG